MEVKSTALVLIALLLGCTCCCCEDDVDLSPSVAEPQSYGGVIQSILHSGSVTTQELERSKNAASLNSEESQQFVSSSTIDVITQTLGLGVSTNGEAGAENALLGKADVGGNREEPSGADQLETADQAHKQVNATKDDGSGDHSDAGEAHKKVESEMAGSKPDGTPQHQPEGVPESLKDEAIVPVLKEEVTTKTSLDSTSGTTRKKGEDASEEDRKESAEKMPTFVEWKQKMLAEHEKGGEQVPEVGGTLPKKKVSSPKSRRNYASYECGAKVLAANSEADGAGRVLNEQVDEYMLNPCKAKIWFVVELCEMIQVSQVDLANFELFSSMPKEFAVSVSDRYPTREWTSLGTFTALDQKAVQSFKLQSEAYGKYIKVELLSKYGSEHYCPLSLVRVFGTSMLDDYEQLVEKPQDPSQQQGAEDDEEDRQGAAEKQVSKNVVDRAKDAVMSILKVLRRDQDGETVNTTENPPCTDLNSNCSVLNVSRLLPHNQTLEDQQRYQRRQQRCRLQSFGFYGSAFQACTTCSHFVPNLGFPQTIPETPACRFLRAAMGPEEDCPFYSTVFKETKPTFTEDDSLENPSSVIAGDARSMNSTESSTTLASDEAQPSSSSASLSDLKSSSTDAAADAVSPMTSLDATPSTKLVSSLEPIQTSSVEESIQVQSSDDPHKNATAADFDVVLEVPKDEGTVKEEEPVPVVLLDSSSFATDAKPLSTTVATPPIAQVPTSVKTTPASSTILATAEKVAPTESAPSPAEATPASSSSVSAERDNAVPVVPALRCEEGGPATTAAPPPSLQDELATEAEAQLREASTMRPPVLDVTSLTGSQKESVFMRINNRIKALELNMSLSGQYLEELSRRYRRQMDDMQRAFNRTVGALNETAHAAAQRDLRQQAALVRLQQQLENLTQVVDSLVAERQTLSRQVFESHVCLILIEAIVLATVFSLCLRRSQQHPTQQATQLVHPQHPLQADRVSSSELRPQQAVNRVVLKRRSVSAGNDDQRIQEFVNVAEKKQKPSAETLSRENSFLIVEPVVPIMMEKTPPKEKAKKPSKKRNRALRRKTSLPALSAVPGAKTASADKVTSSAGVLFSNGASQCTDAAVTVLATQAAKGGTKPPPENTGCNGHGVGGGGGRGRTARGGRQADCVRWNGTTNGYGCCDRDDRLGLVKFLRLPGKTPV
uniref:Putative conserved secreted mucin n=1 Tax=Ixodes scapularis TaxID=6945 RepID=A0A4D5RNX8_IXOSC